MACRFLRRLHRSKKWPPLPPRFTPSFLTRRARQPRRQRATPGPAWIDGSCKGGSTACAPDTIRGGGRSLHRPGNNRTYDLQFEAEIGGRLRTLVVKDQGGGFAVAVDGRSCRVDAARIGADMLSLVIYDVLPKGDTIERPGASAGDRPTDAAGLDGRAGSYEVTVWRDRASGRLDVKIGLATIAVGLDGSRRRRDDGGHARSGPQLVVAPMPGKIVRLLVERGQVVRSGQPLVVVEAMKMENELRATGEGTVRQIHVTEGASVEAGAPLVVIE
ncbi:MAG: hypothetical protein C5B57_09775 [Blastocatellia bacterium]|nr:MAG: hypothetical protein C5B57_09775 [Blastocatellia bacterium]